MDSAQIFSDKQIIDSAIYSGLEYFYSETNIDLRPNKALILLLQSICADFAFNIFDNSKLSRISQILLYEHKLNKRNAVNVIKYIKKTLLDLANEKYNYDYNTFVLIIDKFNEIEIEIADDCDHCVKFEKIKIKNVQEILNFSNTSILWVNKNADIIFANKATIEIIGYSEEEITNLKLFNINQALNSRNWPDFYNKLVQNKMVAVERDIITKSGDRIPFLVATNYVNFAGEDFIFATLISLRELRKIESELSVVENRLRAIINAAPDLVFYKNINGEYLGCNEAFEKFVNKTEKELVGKTDFDLFSQYDAEWFRSHDEKAVKSKKSYTYEEWISYPNGTRALLETIKTPLIDENGEIAGLVGIARDISERNKSELAIKESSAKLRTIFDIAPAGIAILNENLQIIDANSKFNSISGFAPENFKGQSFLKIFNGADIAVVEESFRELKDGVFVKSLEKEIIGKDGKSIWVNTLIAAIDLSDGAEEYLTILNDITELKSKEKELIAAKETAYDAIRARAEFTANFSHEIRTPLNAIIGFSDVLLDQLKNPIYREYVKEIKSSGKNLLVMVNDILTLSKIEAGVFLIQNSEFYLEPFAEDLIQMFERDANQKKLNFSYEIAKHFPKKIYFDKFLLRQILVNTLGNAIKFTNSGFVKFSFSAENFDGDYFDFVLNIQDTGIGISKEKLHDVFEPFIQSDSKSTRNHGGIGLGLTIVKKLIGLANGKIQINSSLGLGSSFVIKFSKIRYREEEQIIPQEETIDIKEDIKALIVSDNDDFIHKTILELSNINIESVSIKNPLAVINLFDPNIFSIIVIDNFSNSEFKEDAIKTLSKLKNIGKTKIFMVSEHYKGSDVLIYDNLVIKFLGFTGLEKIKQKSSQSSSSSKVSDGNIKIGSFIYNKEKNLTLNELNYLEQDLMDDWNLVRRRMILNEIRSFGQSVKEIGVKFKSQNLKNYGLELITQADMFRLDILADVLAFYPELISLMKNK